MSATEPAIRVLPPERGWARNLGRQAGVAAMVLGISVAHWSAAFGLGLAGTVVATACLMRLASNYQRGRFRRQPDRALASRNGVAGQLLWDHHGVRWVPKKTRESAPPVEVPWSLIDCVTIRPLTGLVEACRLVVEPGGGAFVLTAPAAEVEVHLKKSVERGAAANPT